MKRVLAPWLLLCLVASLAGCRAAKVDIAVDIDQEEQAQLGPLMLPTYPPSDTARALAMNTAYAEAINAFGLDLWHRLVWERVS